MPTAPRRASIRCWARLRAKLHRLSGRLPATPDRRRQQPKDQQQTSEEFVQTVVLAMGWRRSSTVVAGAGPDVVRPTTSTIPPLERRDPPANSKGYPVLLGEPPRGALRMNLKRMPRRVPPVPPERCQSVVSSPSELLSTSVPTFCALDRTPARRAQTAEPEGVATAEHFPHLIHRRFCGRSSRNGR
jgi:hypothetical protein